MLPAYRLLSLTRHPRDITFPGYFLRLRRTSHTGCVAVG